MCGIAGFAGHRWIVDRCWQQMLNALAPRGPDAQRVSTWTQRFEPASERAQIALLHTRLSIRDLRTLAHQPMANPAGDIWISYNGEVYGWERDAEELKRRGYHFKTTSDTEFILHGYAEWGIDVLARLRGKFAIALLDQRTKKLYLARDRLGIKPLVYSHRSGEIVFGSTVRSVLPYLGSDERRVSSAGIDAYLAHRYIPAPRTIFKDIERLRAGHYACFDLESGALQIVNYWKPKADAAEFEATLTESVALRTVSDRPVGLFLSGGIDSTAVASVLVGTGHRDITAYTAAFPGTSFDESAQAAQVAQQLGLPHRTLPIEQHIGADFERIVADLDEPFADPSSIPLWYLSRAASEHVRVVMGGDGGDELFAGYKRYAKHLQSRWRRGLRIPVAAREQNAVPGKWEKWRDELSMDWLSAYSLRFSGMWPSLRRYLQPDLLDMSPVYWDRMPVDDGDALETLLAVDMNNYLAEYILRKGDLCTMAHGLELRVPLLDHRLYQTVLALPRGRRFTDPPKQALGAVCELCARLDLFKQKKRGFNPPLVGWLRDELRDRLDGLGARLQSSTNGQLGAPRVDELTRVFIAGRESLAEQVLQLLILDVSLTQLLAPAA